MKDAASSFNLRSVRSSRSEAFPSRSALHAHPSTCASDRAKGVGRSILVGLIMLSAGGCAVPMMVGSAIRANSKNTDIVMGTGVTASMLKAKQHIGLSLKGVSSTVGPYAATYGAGTSNAGVYAGMLSKEFLKLGYETEVIEEPLNSPMTPNQRADLLRRGLDLVLLGDLNMSMTTNISSAAVGGEGVKTGVTGLTLTGVDPANGKVMFIVSVEYGAAQSAGDVALDISRLYAEIVDGKAAATKSARAAVPPSAPVAPVGAAPSATTAEPVAAPVEPSSGTTNGPSVRAPAPDGPGAAASPGPLVPTLRPTLSWRPVEGASSYGIYIRDMTSNTLIFASEQSGTATSMTLPVGKLVPGRTYRWNIRARGPSGFGPYSAPFYFRT